MVSLDEIELTPAVARRLALELLGLADRAERAPRDRARGQRYRGRLVVSRAVHDAAQCGWMVATRDTERPELARCSRAVR